MFDEIEFVRSKEEVERVEEWARGYYGEGSRYPRRSYEQGIIDVMDWLQGYSDDAPDDVDEE